LINPNIPTDMDNVPVEASTINTVLYNYAITNGLYVEGSEFLYFSGATLYKCSVLFGIIHTMAFTATSPVTVTINNSVYEDPEMVDGNDPLIITLTITKAVSLTTLIPYPAKIYSANGSSVGMETFETVYVHLQEGVNTIEVTFVYDIIHFKNAPTVQDVATINYFGQSYECNYIATNPNYDEFMIYTGTGVEVQGVLTALLCSVANIYVGQFTDQDPVRITYDDDSYDDTVATGTANQGSARYITTALAWNAGKTIVSIQKLDT